MKFSTTSIAALAAFCACADALPTDSVALESREADAKFADPQLMSFLRAHHQPAIGKREAEAEAEAMKASILAGNPKLAQIMNMQMIARRDAEAMRQNPLGQPQISPALRQKPLGSLANNPRLPRQSTFQIAKREAEAEAEDLDFEDMLHARMVELSRPKFRIGEVMRRPQQKRDAFSGLDDDYENELHLRDALASALRGRIGMVVNNHQARDLLDSYDADEYDY